MSEQDRPTPGDESPGAAEPQRVASERRSSAPPQAAPVDVDDVPYAPDADWVREQKGSLQYAGVGMQFGFTICLFALLGRWLDGRLGTKPWLLILGVLLGFGGGTLSLLKKFSPTNTTPKAP